MLRYLTSCFDTTLSSILDRTDKLEIGRWLLTSAVSSPGFFSSGVMVAILKIVGTLPVEMKLFISSFIHSGDLYSASSRDYYSEALPAQPRTKKKDLREM